ncbi:MAG: glycosyltransferase family 4 protein [Bacteroidales bacterium]|nr:glycosyltransferase family 4 protein [Bacteroidales bacterium]HOY39421.1 glycosyltransferase family 1 protein [Bacteroidales bacterium]HQP04367.1 glycosyltransferase family 1 protein [Bacteroidales bacterium]
MRIGFDAKRAFFNTSGLGNYSRNCIDLLRKNSPETELVLFTPRVPNSLPEFATHPSIEVVYPNHGGKITEWLWRTHGMSKSASKCNIDLYHGLSNEIPLGLNKRNIPCVVTIHDLIFLRYPELYRSVDRKIYHAKSLASCKYADAIIAVSKQTKEDIINFYGIKPQKIEIIYQNCNPKFAEKISESEMQTVKDKYKIPENYILFVGTIEERKNVITILKAMQRFGIDKPLLLVGKATPYVNTIIGYAENNHIEDKLFIRHQIPDADMPAIYQMADVFVYPSIFEGFGIPVLEAITSGVPVITSNISSLPEAAGPHSILTDPASVEMLGKSIIKVLNDSDLRANMIGMGYQHAQLFSEKAIAEKLINLYHSLI